MSDHPLLTQIAATGGRRSGPCVVARWLDGLPSDIGEAFRTAIEDDAYQTTAIHKIATAHGLSVEPSSLGRHRRHQCGCYRGVS